MLSATLQMVPPLMVRILGLFSPIIREVIEIEYEFAAPYIMDGAKFTRAFGGSPTPHREAMRRTVEWFRQHYTPSR